MKILITGAGGFIGSHLVEEFIKNGESVTALVHYNSKNSYGLLDFVDEKIKNGVKIVLGDINDRAFINELLKNKEIVIHLAALVGIPYSYEAVESNIKTNVLGTLSLLEASRLRGIKRFIHTSTSEVYGSAKYTPIDEMHMLHAQSPYSASKIGADKIVESFVNSFNFPAVTIRPFNNYGPRQSARAVIPSVITQVLTQDKLKIGSIDTIRDFTYVKDTAKAFHKAVYQKNIEGETINIGTGKGYKISEVIKKVQNVTGKKIKIINDKSRLRNETSEVDKLICDNTKAKKLLKWEQTTTLDDGLELTIDWIAKNINNYKPKIFAI